MKARLTMRGHTQLPRKRLAAMLCAALAMIACKKEAAVPDAGRRIVRPECPMAGDSDSVIIDDAGHLYTTVPLPGPLSHIPEFNDCQRFIVVRTLENRQDTVYGPLVAIFAAFRLESLPGRLTRIPTGPVQSGRDPAAVKPSGTGSVGMSGASGGTNALPFAEIYDWGRPYTPLGIAHGFNCLFLFKTSSGAWGAVMVSRAHEPDCPASIRPDTGTTFTMLQVTPRTYPGMADTSYPAVARWDWDSTNARQYIGIKCGQAWCQVGAAGLMTSAPIGPVFFEPVSTDPPALANTPTPVERARVWTVPGWYDFQRLALKVAGTPKPSPIKGWVVPNPLLGRIDAGFFKGHWVHSATAVLTADYAGSVVPLARGENRIYECFADPALMAAGRPSGCGGAPTPTGLCLSGGWFVKVVAPAAAGMSGTGWTPGVTTYRCINRWDHTAMALADHYTIPGAARWRWLMNDESTWNRCTEGCCELR